ncbi:pupal cuticle protein Edg-84A-like [Cherax quadricarinatus]|uniref:pupal cuticle protein Edg-84A-like n=1 Tax=Cherax quadricarinatus TaxID=27406 RepID=UPI00387E43A6
MFLTTVSAPGSKATSVITPDTTANPTPAAEVSTRRLHFRDCSEVYKGASYLMVHHSLADRASVNTLNRHCGDSSLIFLDMIIKAYLVAAVVGVVCAGPMPNPVDRPYSPPPPSYPPAYPQEEEPSKPYSFEYGVKDGYSGANFGHNENSDGKAVSGSYQVDLPDGRKQIVSYVADHHNGFQAQVQYEGEAQYPESPVHQPAYPAPSPYAPAPSYPSQLFRTNEIPAHEPLPEAIVEENVPLEYN